MLHLQRQRYNFYMTTIYILKSNLITTYRSSCSFVGQYTLIHQPKSHDDNLHDFIERHGLITIHDLHSV